MDPNALMDAAIRAAEEGLAIGQTPFGSAIATTDGGRLVAATHNTVWRDTDPSAHAEVNCLRRACGVLKRIDLAGYTLYSTCEPCPMCLAAIHWANLDRVVFGATIADAEAAGFREMPVPAEDLARMGKSRLVVERGPRRQECVDLFRRWIEAGHHPY